MKPGGGRQVDAGAGHAAGSVGSGRPPLRLGRAQRRGLLAAACLYALFVVYGSLVPLDFTPIPFEVALARFERMPYLNLGIGARADWVSNILLFIPLAFLALGTLWPDRGRLARSIALSIVLAGCLGLSVTLEFVQTYFPPRTVSLNDLVAEALGSLVGVGLWWSAGVRWTLWLTDRVRTRTRAGLMSHLLTGYLVLLVGYNVMPLDLTISAVEIYHKWREHKVLIVPFSGSYGSAAEMVYGLLSDTVIWIPAAVLWRLASGRSGTVVVLATVACSAAIEFLQLFVYSRVSSTTNLITAAAGGLLGVGIARFFRVDRTPAPLPASPRMRTIGGWAAAILVWEIVLAVVFFYPFDFNTDWSFVHGRLRGAFRAPFEAYYYGSEFRALTEVLHKTVLFAPLGVLLALGGASVLSLSRIPPAAWLVTSIALISLTAAGIEAGQLFLPGKNADPTDALLECLGGWGGYLATGALRRSWHRAAVGADTRRP